MGKGGVVGTQLGGITQDLARRSGGGHLVPASEPPPAGADPTLRGWGLAPAASARNFAFLSAERGRIVSRAPAPWPCRFCAPREGGGGEGRRRGPGRFAHRAGSGPRRAPCCAATERSCLAPSLFGRSQQAAGSGGGGFLNLVQGAQGAFLLFFFLTPPSSHPAPTPAPPATWGLLAKLAQLGLRAGPLGRSGEEREELRWRGPPSPESLGSRALQDPSVGLCSLCCTSARLSPGLLGAFGIPSPFQRCWGELPFLDWWWC